VLADIVLVIGGGVSRHLLPVDIYHPHVAIVKVDAVLVVHQTHVMGVMQVSATEDEFLVRRVAQHHVPPDLQRQRAKIDKVLAQFDQPRLHLGRYCLGHAAGDRQHGVHKAAAEHGHRLVRLLQVLDHPPSQGKPHLGDHPEDTPLCWIGVGPHDEIGARQHVKVGGVVAREEGIMHQFANLDRGRRRRHLEHGIGRLGRGHVVRRGAHATDALGDARHLFDRATLAKGLKTTELGHLEVGVGHVATFIQEEGDLAVSLEAGDGIDGDALHAVPSPEPSRCAAQSASASPLALTWCSSEAARLKR